MYFSSSLIPLVATVVCSWGAGSRKAYPSCDIIGSKACRSGLPWGRGAWSVQRCTSPPLRHLRDWTPLQASLCHPPQGRGGQLAQSCMYLLYLTVGVVPHRWSSWRRCSGWAWSSTPARDLPSGRTRLGSCSFLARAPSYLLPLGSKPHPLLRLWE